MISNKKSTAIKGQARMSRRKKQQIHVKDDCEQEDRGEDVHDMF